MLANRIERGGTIGIFCPSHVADMERYAPGIAAIERLGFKVKLGANMFKATYGYAAGAEERAEDINALIADDDVQIVLFGGYASLFGLMLANQYFNYDANDKYLLFLEDHEKFSGVGAVCTYFTLIGQSNFMQNVTGLIVGNYAENAPEDLMRFFVRFGDNHNIPVVYTDDFGHGAKHAILPIGARASLDADKQQLYFTYNPEIPI